MKSRLLSLTLLFLGIIMPFSALAQNNVSFTPVSEKLFITAPTNGTTDYKFLREKCKSVGKEAGYVSTEKPSYIDVPSAIIKEGGSKIKLITYELSSLGSRNRYYICPEQAYAENLARLVQEQTSKPLYVEAIEGVWGFFLTIIDSITAWLFTIVGNMFMVMIGQGQFITHPIVQQAWPFIQGIANLGFIIALLYIAFATTLRVESVSTSVQRLLPKLLIAALLVNFSLVIGGLIIDASRVLMAVEIRAMQTQGVGTGNTGAKSTENPGEELAKSLIGSTGFVDTLINGVKSGTNASSSLAANLLIRLQTTIVRILLLCAIGVITINLFARYIALLILLTISPLAFVSFALPKTAEYGKAWWKQFIKWVAYGPIVLFFLLIIIQVKNISPSIPLPSDPTKAPAISYFNALIHFVMVISLFFVANSLGKKVAGIGSDMAMGFANKTGAWARKNPKKALGIGVGLATGGAAGVGYGLLAAGGTGLAQGTGRNLRDYGTGVQSNFMKKTRAGELFGKGTTAAPKYGRGSLSTLAKWAAGPERNEKGDLKPGEDSFLSPYADATFQRQDVKAALADAKRISSLPVARRVAEYAASTTLDPATLLKKRVAMALSKEQKEDIARYGSDEHKRNMASHKDSVRGMNEATKNLLLSDPNLDVRKAIQSRLTSLENEK